MAIIGSVSVASCAGHGDERRRVVDHPQPHRIIRLAHRDEGNALAPRRREFALGVFDRADAADARCAAAARQIGQGGERAARAAEMIEQGAERFAVRHSRCG